MKTDPKLPLTVVAAIALVLDRFYYAYLESVLSKLHALLSLTLLFATFGLGLWQLGVLLRPTTRQRFVSLVLVSLCAVSIISWWNFELGDRYVDGLAIPRLGRYDRVVRLIESGDLRPDLDTTVKLPSGWSDLDLGGSAEVVGTPPDARITFSMRNVGSTVLLAVYEPRKTLRRTEEDDIWWRYVSRKSDHWYLVVWASWD